MGEPFNPYAAPGANLIPYGSEGRGQVWRDGKVLVMIPGAELPHCCVKCGEPAEEPIKDRKVYWHHPALYLLAIFPGLLIYAIVALIVRKQATVAPGLCEAHRKRRNLGLGLVWGGTLLGFGLMIGSLGPESCGLGFLGLFLFLGGLVGGVILARLVYPERITAEYVRLKGCGEGFLAVLPPFHG